MPANLPNLNATLPTGRAQLADVLSHTIRSLVCRQQPLSQGDDVLRALILPRGQHDIDIQTVAVIRGTALATRFVRR